jgi:gamma-glutamyltranspeptidase/glutathione hydrolase
MSIPRELAVMAEQCTGRGRRGVAVAAAPQAAHIGARVLDAGGNAFDAVVAMGLAETVLLPPKCGLGGDLIAIARGRDADPESLLAIGGAPGGLAAVVGGGEWSDTGPNSVGPPGAPAGYAALAARGTWSLADLAAPAVALARDGFAWAEVCNDLSKQSAALVAQWNPNGCAYYPKGEPFATGEIVRLPGLADALHLYAADPQGFLGGEVGRAIVEAVQSRGGVLSLDDMAYATAEWVPCLRGAVHGHDMWVTPAPTYGPTLLAAVEHARPDSTVADEYERFVAAMRANREALADPSGTSMISAADEYGNVVTVVHSNSYPRFGSGIVVDRHQLILNNRAGRGFTPIAGHPNFPVAGRRPATTLHAWALRSATGVYFSGATPGGANQVPWNVQTIGQIIGGESAPGLLVTSPRWEWLPDDDGVRLEGGFSEEKLGDIADRAPRIVKSPRWATRAAQQVVRVSSPGSAIVGGADPRTVGAAVGVNMKVEKS